MQAFEKSHADIIAQTRSQHVESRILQQPRLASISPGSRSNHFLTDDDLIMNQPPFISATFTTNLDTHLNKSTGSSSNEYTDPKISQVYTGHSSRSVDMTNSRPPKSINSWYTHSNRPSLR